MTEINENETEVDRIISLIEAISTRNLASIEDARDFFVFIEAPPHLRCLENVCVHLQAILPILENILSLDSDTDHDLLRKITSWKILANEIVPNFSHSLVTGSLRGDYLEKHALYVALSLSPRNIALTPRYYLLMAHLCYAAHILRRLMIKDKDYVSSRYRAMLKARQLALPKNEDALYELPSAVISLSDYLEYLDKEKDEFQKRLWKLLDYAVEKKPAVTHIGARRKRRSNNEPPFISGDSYNLIEEDETHRPVVNITQLEQLPEDEDFLQQIADTLASPLEFATGRHLVQFDTTAENAPTPRQDAHTARKLPKRLANDNQMLALRWRGLSTYEIACFLEAVDKIAKESGVQLSTGVPLLELAALLTCMFWSSSSLKSAAELKIYRRKPTERHGKGYLVAQKRDLSPSWVINPPRPIGYQRSEKPHFQAETADDLVFLQVPKPARLIIDRYLATRDEHSRSSDGLFPGDIKIYESAVRYFLGRVRRPKRLRLREGRVADFIFEKLLHQAGADIVTAMLITGRDHILGSVPLHYTSVSKRELCRRYDAVCNEIITSTHAELGLYGNHINAIDIRQNESSISSTRVGTRYCPRTKTVRTLVADLKQLLLAANTQTATVEDILTLHNRMVVYTTVLVGFASGYRAVSDPYLRRAFIDPAAGFAVISDKDTTDNYHSRLIWVPNMVLEQLNYYHEHLEAFGRRLLILNRKIYFEIRERLMEASSRPMLFMLKNNLKSLTVSKGSLESICVHRLEYYLPANANRHYVRTRLLRRGCPRDVISAYMGHWEHGTEPWGEFSTLSPQTYRENLEHFLLPVLLKDGWESIPGLGGNSD